jgi:ubiquinone/menaquinone biosynthesis C-methylase UbiE
VAHVREQGYRAYQADVEALPFPDKSFDYVLCLETLEHAPNPISALNELARVCRKKIHLTIPWIARTRINRKSDKWPSHDSHIFEFDKIDFQKVLTHSRVTVDYQARVQVFPEPRNPLSQAWLKRFM